MIMLGIPAALQEKNEQEFIEVTRRIQEALTRIESNPKLKATQEVLAELANCSRGTLNNRKWPLDRLREIKASRKAPVQTVAKATTAEAKIESRIDHYKQQLYDSREEVLLWKTRHDEAVQRLAQAQDLIRVLQARLAATEEEISKLRGGATVRVVGISSKQSK